MLFVTHFNKAKPVKKLAIHLMFVRQERHKSLEAYTKGFNNKVMLVEDFTDQAIIQGILSVLKPDAFKWDIAKNTLKTLTEIIEEAQKHVIVKGLVFMDEVEAKSRKDKPLTLKIQKSQNNYLRGRGKVVLMLIPL